MCIPVGVLYCVTFSVSSDLPYLCVCWSSRQEKEVVALELGSAFAVLLTLADQCNVDL